MSSVSNTAAYGDSTDAYHRARSVGCLLESRRRARGLAGRPGVQDATVLRGKLAAGGRAGDASDHQTESRDDETNRGPYERTSVSRALSSALVDQPQ